MNAFPKETLMSERGSDGLWHARYPTATVTLCGRRRAEPQKGRRHLPTCASCLDTAQAFDDIDGTMPDAWRASTITGLKEQVIRLRARVRELERSRDQWRARALDGERAALVNRARAAERARAFANRAPACASGPHRPGRTAGLQTGATG